MSILIDMNELESTTVAAKAGKRAKPAPEWFADVDAALSGPTHSCALAAAVWEKHGPRYREAFKTRRVPVLNADGSPKLVESIGADGKPTLVPETVLANAGFRIATESRKNAAGVVTAYKLVRVED